MNILITLVLLLILLGVIAALVATVRADGYGDRPGPRSHHEPDLRWWHASW